VFQCYSAQQAPSRTYPLQTPCQLFLDKFDETTAQVVCTISPNGWIWQRQAWHVSVKNAAPGAATRPACKSMSAGMQAFLPLCCVWSNILYRPTFLDFTTAVLLPLWTTAMHTQVICYSVFAATYPILPNPLSSFAGCMHPLRLYV